MTVAQFEKEVSTKLERNYDMQLSYTALKNFGQYFIRGSKNRFGIWNYETTVLPKAFGKGFRAAISKTGPPPHLNAHGFITLTAGPYWGASHCNVKFGV